LNEGETAVSDISS